jgi:flagellar L-ring protein FlgH
VTCRFEQPDRIRSLQLRASAAVLLLLSSGCGVSHIEGFTPRKREYRAGAYEKAPLPVSDGSLWQESSRSLVADFRASRVGDLVMVRIDESPKAQGDAETKLERESNLSMGAPKLFGFAQAIAKAHPDLDMAEFLNVMSSSSFDGSGETTRGSNVTAAMAVRVKRQLPNGDMFVEGTKVLMVNDEELHIYISGVIRPEDIAQDNSVPSSVVADAQIEFVGRGVLTDNQRKGWFTTLLSWLNPF